MRLVMTRSGKPEVALGPGWSQPEPAFTWAVGRESWLFLESPPVQRPCRLIMRVWPHVQPGSLPRQRIVIEANRQRVAEAAIAERTVVIGLIRPEIFVGREVLGLRFIHPDHARPCDFATGNGDNRALAVAYETVDLEELEDDEAAALLAIDGALAKATPVPAPADSEAAKLAPADVVAAFESAGDDCEFGFVQRHFGLEQLGLLRFSGITLENPARGLRNRFAGIAENETLRMEPHEHAPNHDVMGQEATYGISYHTYRFARDTDLDALLRQERRRLPRLATKFLEDIEAAEKIFIVKSCADPPPAQIACLYAVFRRLGRAPLLWIRRAPAGVPPGTAAWLLPGLMVGYVDRLEPPPLLNISPESWLAACRAALALVQAQKP